MLLPLPDSAETITPRWLSTILGRGVSRCELTRIGEDEGFTGGALFRISVQFDDSSEPETLVAKLSPSEPEMRRTMARLNAREVQFYTRFAADGDIAAPRCHYGAFEATTGASFILIEDMARARTVAFNRGASMGEASLVIDALVDIHGAFWGSDKLADLDGGGLLDEFDFAACWGQYPKAVQKLLPDVVLPKSFLALGNWLAVNHRAVFAALQEQGPQTCLHRDAQLDNLLFLEDGAALLDWQFLGKGRGVYDVAYFLASSLEPEVRRGCEDPLLERYHRGLLACGVEGYSIAQLQREYLLAVVGKIFITVNATVLLDNSGAHKTDWRRVDLQRLLAFCEDHAITPALLAG
jgi:hypothetical protein